VVKLETTYVSELAAQSLRDLIQESITSAKPVEIEVRKGDKRNVVFKEFLKINCAIGTTDNGKTTVLVLLDEDVESGRSPLVALGR